MTRWRRLAAAFGVHAALVGAPVHAGPPADCPPTPTLPSAAEFDALRAVARDHGFLWRIRKDDDRASWLYGTIHVGRRDWALPGPTVGRALGAVDTLALELDPLDPAMQTGLAQALAAMRRPVLTDALAERLARQAREACLPDAAFAGLAPTARTMTLSTLVGRRDGLDPAYGIDGLLAAFGHARHLDVVSLETPALQLAVFDPGGDDESVEWIESSLGEIERGTARAELARLAAAWADGDLDALTVCPGAACADSASDRALERRVIDDRNPALAAEIDALHRAGKRVFAAVGSLHMTGPLGLPALLAARGYRVERVRFGKP